jgi:2-phospho-L-lactate guanylyltransferase
MMDDWFAVVPLKPLGERKTRLHPHMDEAARDQLSTQLFVHVIQTLEAVPEIRSIHLLSDKAPQGWTHGWIPDEGRGLNEEIAAARQIFQQNFLTIHADLPLLSPDDIKLLISVAEKSGSAIAPDRHHKGTNALALRADVPFRFAFGNNSLEDHMKVNLGKVHFVLQNGLALDIDTKEDFDLAINCGFELHDTATLL